MELIQEHTPLYELLQRSGLSRKALLLYTVEQALPFLEARGYAHTLKELRALNKPKKMPEAYFCTGKSF